jgi:hypothetical protein
MKNLSCRLLHVVSVHLLCFEFGHNQANGEGTACVPSAQKVKIESMPGQYIQLFSVQVFSSVTGPSIATGKAASQSTTLEESTPAFAALDHSDPYSFSHTAKHDPNAAWWEVDLGSMLSVRALYIGQHMCRYAPDPTMCFCHLGGSNIMLIDDVGTMVAKYSLDFVCAKRHAINFDSDEYCNPTGSPTTSFSIPSTNIASPSSVPIALPVSLRHIH